MKIKSKKVISLACAMVILFATLLPNVSLAATELINTVTNENAVTITNIKKSSEENNIITNEIQNDTINQHSNKILTQDNNIQNSLNILNDKEIKNDTQDSKTIEKEINTEEKIEVVENEEEFITMQKEKDNSILDNSNLSANQIRLYSTRNTTLYVIQLASYISTTVHNREDGYGILVRKIATNSSYSDIKQAFCIEMRSRLIFWFS